MDSYDPALKEHRAVCFLAFDGSGERQAVRVLYRGGQGRLCRPSASGVALTLRTCSGADLRKARRQLMDGAKGFLQSDCLGKTLF